MSPPVARNANPELTIVGHRGSGLLSTDNKTVIGNTRTALTKGIAAGADWIEIDVRETSDGHLVARYFTKDQIILFGTYDVLQDYRDSSYLLGLTFLFRKPSNRLRTLCHHSLVVQRAESLGCDYLVLPIIFASQPLVDAATSKGLEVWTYGSEDKRDW